LVLEIDVLPRSNFQVPSEVFPQILRAVAELKNTTPEEIEAMNHKNVSKLVGNDPRLEQMNRVLKT